MKKLFAKIISEICYYILDKRVGWGEKIIRPFDIWLNKHII